MGAVLCLCQSGCQMLPEPLSCAVPATMPAAAQVVCKNMNLDAGRLLPASTVASLDPWYVVNLRCPTGNEQDLDHCSWQLGSACAHVMGVACKGEWLACCSRSPGVQSTVSVLTFWTLAQVHALTASACETAPLPGRAWWRLGCHSLGQVCRNAKSLPTLSCCAAAWLQLPTTPTPSLPPTPLAGTANWEWGVVCATPAITQAVAAAACRQLGFSKGMLGVQGQYPDIPLPTVISNVDCPPGAASLNNCFYLRNFFGLCDGSRFLTVNCTAA